jgi:hypothetical protein
MDGQTKPVGRARGRFGVTRDADGSFATIYAWPWYWRYPFALCAGAGLFAFALSLSDGREKLALYLIGGVGGIFILSVVYELFATLVVIGLLWWIYQSVSESNGAWRSAVEAIVGGFVVGGIYHLLRQADDTQKVLSESNARLAAMEQRLGRMHYELRQVRDRNAQFRDLDDDL